MDKVREGLSAVLGQVLGQVIIYSTRGALANPQYVTLRNVALTQNNQNLVYIHYSYYHSLSRGVLKSTSV